MKKIIASIVACIMFCLPSAALAAETEVASPARLIEVEYTYTDSIILNNDFFDWPVGYAKFDITIKGVYDEQGGNVISIDSATCRYRGGVNCEDHNMEVVTWTSSADRGVVYWRLEGDLTLSWTSPTTGLEYETVYIESDDYSFDAYDYI